MDEKESRKKQIIYDLSNGMYEIYSDELEYLIKEKGNDVTMEVIAKATFDAVATCIANSLEAMAIIYRMTFDNDNKH